MKVKLIFDDWRKKGQSDSIYNTDLGVLLSSGVLHSGSTFEARLDVDPELEDKILRAWSDHGAYPVFRLIPEE